ncbi:hypothetical protein N6H13_21995 [Paenibacillus sp. CC-CFT742]|nr:hypothetical protein [Paenibacillus sp. CC-CFT742]WJH27827.1 hypothetical protein N6H13_21995 [Paenibacillus sp. CC-CFT742]
MRTFFGVLFIIVALPILLLFLALLTRVQKGYDLFIVVTVFLLPGIILMWAGIKNLNSRPKISYSVPPYPRNNYVGNDVDNNHIHRLDSDIKPNVFQQNINVFNGHRDQQVGIDLNHDSALFNTYNNSSSQNEHRQEVQRPKVVVSAECTGCGAKVKVQGTMSAECEYCGTTVQVS